MDDSNPAIQFDFNGQCSCCRDALARMPSEWWVGQSGKAKLDALVLNLKTAGQGKPYDAMIGMSGGIDSAYLAHVAVRQFGLRVLAVHVDGGWNTAPAVHNIESITRALNLDLHTYVVEWQEMRDLQLAFLKASVLNQDIPQDHAFFSTLYRTAADFGMQHFLSGVNFASESVMPPAFGFPYADDVHLRAVHGQFGTVPLSSYPLMRFSEFLWKTRVRRQLTVHKPLNFMSYSKQSAKLELQQAYGWRDYGGKHNESRFTKFFQEYYLPTKFKFDKRRLHLSSLIVSGQLSRNEALAELDHPIAPLEEVKRDLRFVAKKLGITVRDLESMVERPPVPHMGYPNQQWLHRGLALVRGLWRRTVLKLRRTGSGIS